MKMGFTGIGLGITELSKSPKDLNYSVETKVKAKTDTVSQAENIYNTKEGI